MAHLLAFAGVVLWTLSIAVVVQRQRVLARRLARLERMAGVRRRPAPPDDLVAVLAPRVVAKGQAHLGPRPPASNRVPKPPPPKAPEHQLRYPISGDIYRPPTLPTVQQLAALARPLQRAGG